MTWFACKIENEKEYNSLNFNNSELSDVKHIIINTSSSDKAIKLILFYYSKNLLILIVDWKLIDILNIYTNIILKTI